MILGLGESKDKKLENILITAYKRSAEKIHTLKYLYFIAILLTFSAYIEYSNVPVYETQNPIVELTADSLKVKEGKKMALTICFRCHYNESTNTLSGRKHGNPKRLGDFSSGNITNDSLTGIGGWSNGQLYYFLKTGIKPNGEYVFDMPKYPNLSEDDILGVIAFLKSNDSLVRKTQSQNPKPRFSFLTKLLLHTVLRPLDFNLTKTPPPDTNNLEKYGKYLATAKYSCYECHSLNMVTNSYTYPEKSWGFFKGGNPHVNEEREKIVTPNITGDSVKGIGKWTLNTFKTTVKYGIKPNGQTVKDPMFPFYLLSDNEVKSIYLFLKTIP